MSTIGTLTEEYRKGEKNMSYTGKTTHYELPQYVGTDIPSILTDLNETYEKIDESMFAIANQQSTDEAQVTALAQQVNTQASTIAQNATNIASEISARQDADSALDNRLDVVEGKIGTVTSKTLDANATSISFAVPSTGNYIVDFFVSDGSNYTAISTIVGSVTLTFEAVASARTVSCRVSGV